MKLNEKYRKLPGSEVYEILLGFLTSSNPSVCFFQEDNNDDEQEFQAFIEEGEWFPFEEPDFFIIKDDKILIIEHFRFSCCETGDRGDLAIKAQKKIDQKFDSFMEESGEGTFHERIRAPRSYTMYYSNFRQCLRKHYEKIDNYLKRVKDCVQSGYDDIRICFLAEDVSPGGSVVFSKKEGMMSLEFSGCKEIIDELEQCPRANWVFSIIGNGKEKRGFFFSQSNLSIYKKEARSYIGMCMLWETVHVCGGKIELKD